jgi:hypothetical protein
MAKFDLKKAILENKATFFGSLTEGQFSWFTQDTTQQIGSEDENTLPFVYMHDNKGNKWLEKRYEGYGEFGGKDYYELLDQMNGGKGDRGRGIDLAFNKGDIEAGKILFPALTVSATLSPNHDFTEEAEHDPNQSWYTPEEDEDDDYIMGDREDDEYLDESKIEEGLTPLQQHVYDFESEVSGEDFAEEEKENIMNLKTVSDVKEYYANYRGWMDDSSLREMLMDLLMDLSSEFPKLKEGSNKSEVKEAMDVAKDMTTQEASGHAERFARYMSNKEGGEFIVTAGSVEGPSFDLDLDGEKYDGGSYIILTNGDIVNVAVPNNPVYANISMLDEAEKPKTKMKKSEFKDKIKEMVLAEMEKDVNISDETPENEEDFLAEIEALLAEADEEAPAEDAPAEDAPAEEETAVDDTEVAADGTETTDVETTTEVDPNVKAVQDALTQAQAAAQQLGDKKLTDQIGNTITFFTRAHVVDKGAVAEGEEMEEGEKEYYDAAESDDAAHINALEKDMEDDKDSSMKIKEVVFPMWQRIK